MFIKSSRTDAGYTIVNNNAGNHISMLIPGRNIGSAIIRHSALAADIEHAIEYLPCERAGNAADSYVDWLAAPVSYVVVVEKMCSGYAGSCPEDVLDIAGYIRYSCLSRG